MRPPSLLVRRARAFLPAVAVATLLFAPLARAQTKPRVQVSQNGDFLLVGNTLAQNCNAEAASVVQGTVDLATGCGKDSDTGADLFWKSDAPTDGQATADLTLGPADAAATTVLTIPTGARITHAYLFWSAMGPADDTKTPGVDESQPDGVVTLSRPGADGFTQEITSLPADRKLVVRASKRYWQCSADVGELVRQRGSGAYRLSGVSAFDFRGKGSEDTAYAGFWMVAFYELPTEPPRNLALFDTFEVVEQNGEKVVELEGFKVPQSGFQGKLGVVGFEGDQATDSVKFNTTKLTDGLPGSGLNNFFNSSHTLNGVAVSPVGDLPQLSGKAGSLSGIDIDVVDVTPQLKPGDTKASVTAAAGGDVVFLSGFVTSISNLRPEFVGSTKTVVDDNGGGIVPGDTLTYSITATNNGNDPSIETVITDVLPKGLSYVAGSATLGGKKVTDAAGDDGVDYDAQSGTLTARIGDGASASTGGSLAPKATAVLTFQAKIEKNAKGTIDNQATITASGKSGAASFTTVTDGNGVDAGTPPTSVFVNPCVDDSQCGGEAPRCDVASEPHVCVACLVDADCGPNTTCDEPNRVCVCAPSGPEICDGVDNDCNGTIDDGFQLGESCAVGAGICAKAGVRVCAAGAATCSATAGASSKEICGDGLDSDCDGERDNGCEAVDPDLDGLPTTQEKTLGTDPNNPDTDGDGLSDGKEVNGTGTDPLDKDSDQDALTDGQEVNETETDPLKADTDGDGLRDGLEIELGTDPTTADTDGDGLPDGKETNQGKTVDTDEDGFIDARDLDSDNDCVPDQEEPKTWRDPKQPAADPNASCGGDTPICDTGAGVCTSACKLDTECGAADSGRVCDAATQVCVDGCRETGQNGCPEGQVCEVAEGDIGQCVQPGDANGGADGRGNAGASGASIKPNGDLTVAGGACALGTLGAEHGSAGRLALLALVGAAGLRRVMRRRHSS